MASPNFGSFAGGLASGLQSGIGLDLQGQQLELQKATKQFAQRKAALDQSKQFGEMFVSVASIQDEVNRALAADNLGRAIEATTGQPAKDIIKVLKSNPEKALELFKAGQESGMTAFDMFQTSNNPLMMTQAVIAVDQAGQQRRGLASAGGTAPTTPQPQTEPSTDPLTTRATAIQRELTGLRQRRGVATESIRNPQLLNAAVKGIDEQIGRLETELRDITTGETLAERKAGRETISAGEAQELQNTLVAAGRSDLANTVSEGMRRSVADALRRLLPRAPIPASAVVGQPEVGLEDRSPAERAAISAVHQADAAGLPATVTVPAAQTTERQTAPRRRPLTTEERREAQLRQELEQKTKLEQVRGREEVAVARLRDWEKSAEDSRKRLNTILAMETLHSQIGPTGELIGPIRVGFNNFAQVLGVEKATGLSELQLFDKLNLKLAVESLRDFSGPDTERDVLNAIKLNPGIRGTRAANAVLVSIAKQEGIYQQDRIANARRWVSDFGSLNNKDPDSGLTFDEGWQRYVNAQPKVGQMVAERLGLKLSKPKGR